MQKNKNKFQNGFSLVEIIVSVAIFAILATSIYGVFTAIINGIAFYREKATISFIANKYLEIVRNMPYSEIGTLEGNPHGDLADLPNPLNLNFNGKNYQVYYAISYTDDSADGTILLGTDPAPNDYKQVKLYVKNESSGALNSFFTNVSPKGLEGMENGGALSVQVFDAVGQPVSGAVINILNNSITPNINLTRTTNSNGEWLEVGLPESANNYKITASKAGYSTDKTYPITEQNPEPIKPDSTILNSQVTKISFSIDKLSQLAFNTLTQACSPISGISLSLHGDKLIGTPNLYKFDDSFESNYLGNIEINNIEWDNYTPFLTEEYYMIYGSSPIQQVSIFPDTAQTFSLILGPKTDNSLLVIVKDSATGDPIEGAEVNLQLGSQTLTGYTNGSIWSQQDWEGNSGQEDDGNISTSEIPYGLRLLKIGSDYVPFGSLVSSVFDTGTNETSYTTLFWQPTSQDPLTEIKFQLAGSQENTEETEWNFLGPDGTSQSFYTVPGSAISNLDNKRYIRYKVFLSTSDSSKTPVLTSVSVNYVSGCYTPGQVMFPNLEHATYTATITKDSYQTQSNDLEVENYKVFEILLSQ